MAKPTTPKPTPPDPQTGEDQAEAADIERRKARTEVSLGEIVFVHRGGPDNHESDYVTISGNPGPIPAIVVRDHGDNVITVAAFPEGRDCLSIRSIAKRTAELVEDRRHGMCWDTNGTAEEDT